MKLPNRIVAGLGILMISASTLLQAAPPDDLARLRLDDRVRLHRLLPSRPGAALPGGRRGLPCI